MADIDLSKEGEVFVLRMKAGENRFNEAFLRELSDRLEEVEASSGPAALVTVGEGKFYSNGLDLQWLAQHERDVALGFIRSMLQVFAKLLACPVPTVAAINGHAFAAGGMMALAHDYRVMRKDRGYFCLPEIDLQMPLAAGMTALIKARLGGALLRDTVLQGLRISGEAARARGLVDDIYDERELLPAAIDLAAALSGKDRRTYAVLKRSIYAEALAVLESDRAADLD